MRQITSGQVWHLVVKPSARVLVNCFVEPAGNQRQSQSIGISRALISLDYVIYYVKQLLCQGKMAILHGRNTRAIGWFVSAWITAFHSETSPQGPPPLPTAFAANLGTCSLWHGSCLGSEGSK
jgi:hypothetical protein